MNFETYLLTYPWERKNEPQRDGATFGETAANTSTKRERSVIVMQPRTAGGV